MRASVSESVLEEVRRAIQQAGEQMLDEAAARVRPHRSATERRSIFGDPAAAIAAEAETGYDLVVMGNRGPGKQPSLASRIPSLASPGI